MLRQDNAQKKVPSARKFIEHSPGNYQESDMNGVWNKWKVRKFYTMATEFPSQPVDGSAHAAFQALLSAAHGDEAWSALRDLGCVKDDEQFVHRQKLHLPLFRSIMTSLSGVFLLDGVQRGCKCICTCRCFALMGECSHINFVLWLNADPSIPPLAPLSSLTLKGVGRLSEADEELRRGAAKGRPLKLPEASAWLTLQHLRLRCEKRSEIRRQARTEQQKAAWKIFREGLPTSPDDALNGQARRSRNM